MSGLSGQAIIAAVFKGERDPYKLADLADYRVKASREEVARSLEGNWRGRGVVRTATGGGQLPFRRIGKCRNAIEKPALYLTNLPTRTLDIPAPSNPAAETAVQKRKKARKPRDNEPVYGDLGSRHRHERLSE